MGHSMSIYLSSQLIITQGLCSNTLNEQGFFSLPIDQSVARELIQSLGHLQICPYKICATNSDRSY